MKMPEKIGRFLAIGIIGGFAVSSCAQSETGQPVKARPPASSSRPECAGLSATDHGGIARFVIKISGEADTGQADAVLTYDGYTVALETVKPGSDHVDFETGTGIYHQIADSSQEETLKAYITSSHPALQTTPGIGVCEQQFSG
jgi:hypothetical protein